MARMPELVVVPCPMAGCDGQLQIALLTNGIATCGVSGLSVSVHASPAGYVMIGQHNHPIPEAMRPDPFPALIDRSLQHSLKLDWRLLDRVELCTWYGGPPWKQPVNG